ncbi:hypothetical protein Zmor_014549 [Zophobas morio]|uniref:Uncharacterized protein n=1 Tax=Zophobas morio TaxID=2755281 RepID=A0AA38MG91_9CUCU|nr:hypothetical protein Zmor_014549 [Zophobas morio]
MLGFIMRNGRMFNDIMALKTLYYGFVVSKLEYGSIVWSPLYLSHQLQLERVQRKFLKYISFKIDGSYPERGIDYSSLLHRHGLSSLSDRRGFQCSKFMLKLITNKIDCPYKYYGLCKLSCPETCITLCGEWRRFIW